MVLEPQVQLQNIRFRQPKKRRPRDVGITAWSTRMGRLGTMNYEIRTLSNKAIDAYIPEGIHRADFTESLDETSA